MKISKIINKIKESWGRVLEQYPAIAEADVKFELVCDNIFTKDKVEFNMYCEKIWEYCNALNNGFRYEVRDGIPVFGWVLHNRFDFLTHNQDFHTLEEGMEMTIINEKVWRFASALNKQLLLKRKVEIIETIE